MDLLKFRSSNNTENKDTSHYNHIKEQLWFYVLAAVAVLILLVFIIYCLRKYIEGPQYLKPKRLEGKVVIITGCNRGIGKETALEMARRGATVYMACRNFDKCEETRLDIIKQTKNLQVFNRTLDLASLESVRLFVQQFLKEESQLHILIHNAAIITKKRQISPEGYELQLATNYMGHFLLTNLLLNTLKSSGPSRIVVITSSPYIMAGLNKKDLQSEKYFIWFKAFLQSKFCQTLFILQLNEMLKDSQVTINCLYPGLVRTDLLLKNTWCLFHPLIRFFTKTIKSGAQCCIYLAVDPEVEEKSGGFYIDMKKKYLPPWVKNFELAEWLWQESIQMVGMENF